MRIGIDVSQIIYQKTGVSEYVTSLVENLIKIDRKNEYVLFFSSFRRNFQFSIFNFQSIPSNVTIKQFKFPPTFLDLVWNKLHILSIDKLIGPVDIFITSDWTEPPSKALKTTILYDLTVYKTPRETDKKIVEVQKRKLNWVKKESSVIFCISEATKKDAMEILGIGENKLVVVYPGS